MQGPIHVKSEIGPLQKVLLHRPGRELEYLVPDALERLLFDDIPYLHGAQQEHDRFVQLLRENGTEVVFLEDLTAEAIETDDPVRDAFIDAVISGAGALAEYYRPELTEYLKSISDAHVLVEKTMSGICVQELPASQKSCLGRLMQQDDHFVMDPIPNLYFTRDPFACIGNGVSLNRMHSQTRCRETIYGRFILKYHPEFSDRVPLYYTPELPTSIEGGDILNLSAQVIAVGVSQRTQPESVELLAHNLFDAQALLLILLFRWFERLPARNQFKELLLLRQIAARRAPSGKERSADNIIERLMRFVRLGSLQKSVQRLFKFVAHHALSPHKFGIYSFCVVFYHDFLQNTT